MVGSEETAYLAPIALTVLLSWGFTGLATYYAIRRGLLDHPGDRHSHHQPTPRGGGAGLVLALLLAAAFLAPGLTPRYWSHCIAPGIVAIATLGWWDDHQSLSVRLRLAVQAAVISWFVFCVMSDGLLAGPIQLVFVFLFVAWMTNLYNFMDGSNGMAGLQGVFSGLALAWLFAEAGDTRSAMLGFLLAAACVGFLPWNLGRPRVFMGDVGSLALGFSLGALLVRGVAGGAFSMPVGLLVMAVFLTDSTATLLARVMRGERWYNAHRQHLYQRFIAHGWSHRRIAFVYQAINLAVVVPAIGVAVRYPELSWLVFLVIASGFVLGWYVLTRKFGVLAQAG